MDNLKSIKEKRDWSQMRRCQAASWDLVSIAGGCSTGGILAIISQVIRTTASAQWVLTKQVGQGPPKTFFKKS